MSILELLKGGKHPGRPESAGLIATIENALKEKEWEFERDEGHSERLRIGLAGHNTDLRGVFLARQEKDQVFFYVHLPTKTPEGRRREAAEFITRANYGLSIGNFEMDMEDGEIRFKVSMDVEGGTLSPPMVINMMMTGFTMVDRYFPGFMSVMYGNAIPAVAVREIES